jgi:hypothetical protein
VGFALSADRERPARLAIITQDKETAGLSPSFRFDFDRDGCDENDQLAAT